MSVPFAPRIVDRYIFKHLIDYFLLAVIVFSLVAFFSDTLLDYMRDVQKIGLHWSTTLTLIGLQMPRIVALILPASSFLAALIVYSNLNNDFELIAMRMNGISLSRLMAPALVLGLGCTIAAYLLNDFVVPYANQRAQAIQRAAFQKAALPSGGGSFMYQAYDDRHNLQQMIYVASYKGRKLGDSTIIDLSKSGVMQVVQARSGKYNPAKGWFFKNANIYLVSTDSAQSSAGHSDSFVVRKLLNKDKEEEIESEIQQLKDQGLNITSDQQNFWQMLSVIRKREAVGYKVMKGHYLSLWKKLTYPLSCLVIILSAVPLALSPPRSGNNRGFVYALGVLFLFYVLMSVFEVLGKERVFDLGGLVPESTALMLAAWGPIFVMVLLGIVLIRRKSRVL